MAIEHKTLPVGGVQFHPESLMSLGGRSGPAHRQRMRSGFMCRRVEDSNYDVKF